MENQTDEQLVALYLQGRPGALEILLDRYLSPLYNFAFKYTHSRQEAEDVTQEAFVKIWHNLKNFDGRYKFKTWAYTITKNTALDALKKKGLLALPESEEALSQALVSREPLPEQLMQQVDDAALVGRAVSGLPPRYREIIALYYNGGLNFREIAEKLKQSINTVKTRHRRALLHLKKSLADKH